MNFPSIDIQGSIISSDLLGKIRSEHAGFQLGKDFNKDFTNPKLKDEISSAWQDAKGQWTIFQHKLSRLQQGESGTTETRNFWIVPLLTNLGYNLNFSRQTEELNGKSFPISYRDSQIDGFPVYIGGFNESLDRRPENKQLRVSPHAMVQEYLNYSEHLYGLVTNGRQLRLLRDASRITRLSYLEFNLQKMMEEDLYSDFVLLYRLLHVSRMPVKIDGGAESIIEKYHQEGLEAGSTIRSNLGRAVKDTIKDLANGFLNHPDNNQLREAMQNGTLKADQYYHHQLRIIYRLLFLFVIEERNLVFADSKTPETKRFSQIYFNYYSLLRLRKLARKLSPPDSHRHYDLWQSLLSTFSLFENTAQGEKLGIMALHGDIFSYDALENSTYDLHYCKLSNAIVLNLLKNLCYFDTDHQTLAPVNYGGLDVEEFGSVYEGLLELKLKIEQVPGSDTYSCTFDTSTERSKSGSHYTPEELVQPLIKHSLEYLIEDRVAGGQWLVVSGQGLVVSKNEDKRYFKIARYELFKKLSGINSLAEINGLSKNDLLFYKVLSERRDIWLDFANKEGSSEHTSQHSRGTVKEYKRGISSVPGNSQRLFSGIGDFEHTLKELGISDTSAMRKFITAMRGDRETFERINKIIEESKTNYQLTTAHQPLTTAHWPLTTAHWPLTTAHWPLTTSKQPIIDDLLSLKICDVACGSGHILLSAARRIALEMARIQTDEEQPNPMSIRKAMKQVVKECIYGVDKNPLAVELCKVALWLEAHNPGEPLSFLDHHIKCGDAIVGLAHREELENGIADEAFKTLPGDEKEVAQAFARRNKQERIQKAQITLDYHDFIDLQVNEAIAEYKLFNELPENTPEEIETKQKAYSKFESATYKMRLQQLADAQIAQFFIPKTNATKDKIITDAEYRKELGHNPKAIAGILNQKFAYATAIAIHHRFFHWFLEFPDVFHPINHQPLTTNHKPLTTDHQPLTTNHKPLTTDHKPLTTDHSPGFDCILGNPPFLGGKKISGSYGNDYLNFIKTNYEPSNGGLDLVVYFFRRIFTIIGSKGFQSLISTNTICQGDSRVGGLEFILNNNGYINFAVKSIKWPGLAAVEVSLVTICKTKINLLSRLNNKSVDVINSYLENSENSRSAQILLSSSNLGFMGSNVLGSGFILDFDESTKLIMKNSKNSDVIYPFLNADDINNSPSQSPSRNIINFSDWTLELCENEYPDCIKIIREKVKPERDKVNRATYRDNWWLYAEKGINLYKAIKPLKRYLVVPFTTKYLTFTFKSGNIIISHAGGAIALEEYKWFALISNTFHEQWAWLQSSTMGGNTLRYTPSSALSTFPFPENLDTFKDQQLEEIGEKYYEYRRNQMLVLKLGLTKTYNALHSKELHLDITKSTFQAIEKHVIEKQHGKEVWNLWNHLQKTPGTCSFEEAIAGIIKLRELHVQMDNAVLEAYGWQDIQLRHDFYEVDYLPENDRVRFTIHPDARKEVLKRLLELNHKIHAEEVAAGLWDKKTTKEKKYKKKDSEDSPNKEVGFGDLFGE